MRPLTTLGSAAEGADRLGPASSPVVIVPVHDAHDDVVRCLEALDAHTPASVAVVIVDDGSRDERLPSVFAALGRTNGRTVVVLRHRINQGYVRSCNDGFAATAGHDVVLLNSDVIVGEEWLERLAAAALSHDSIATASTLTNHGTILSVPYRNDPRPALPGGLTPTEAARRVAAGSRRTRPPIPTAVGHCCYIRRRALDLVGTFDETFSPGYGEEVDFSQRATTFGFRHVCADDVFTYHRGSGSFGTTAAARQRQEVHERIVRARYPWYAAAVAHAADDPASGLADALGAARRSLVGLAVGIDALCLGPTEMGTQHIVVETIRALAGRAGIDRLVVFVPEHLPPYAADLRDAPGVELVVVTPPARHPPRLVDVVYRPYQVTRPDELEFLRNVADRFVVNQLDTIAYENPAYFADEADWTAYRATTRATLALADGVAFLSDFGRRSAATAGLVGPGRPIAIVACGVELGGRPGATSDPAVGERPGGFGANTERFILCVGASYLHKNRSFALRVWHELRQRGWTGRIVLAGPTPQHGSSRRDEDELLLAWPDIADDVVALGPVTDDEKRWLYHHAGLVIYASSCEGFGLVPFEAAAHGVATLASGLASLAEVLPPDAPVLDGFDVHRAADAAWLLLHDDVAAKRAVESIRARGECFTWKRTADHLHDLFTDVLARPRHVPWSPSERPDDAPEPGRSPRRVAAATSGALELAVHAVILRPGLKHRLSPDGSRRQATARRTISLVRRTLAR
ncbi:MAG: glycosyltransferase [Ilumatobacteraceae bacterium]